MACLGQVNFPRLPCASYSACEYHCHELADSEVHQDGHASYFTLNLAEELERVRSELDNCRRKLVKEVAASASAPTTPVHSNSNHSPRVDSKADRKELEQLTRQKADLESQLAEVEVSCISAWDGLLQIDV
jgi:predicted metal-dependent phosphoesterase TrpH